MKKTLSELSWVLSVFYLLHLTNGRCFITITLVYYWAWLLCLLMTEESFSAPDSILLQLLVGCCCQADSNRLSESIYWSGCWDANWILSLWLLAGLFWVAYFNLCLLNTLSMFWQCVIAPNSTDTPPISLPSSKASHTPADTSITYTAIVLVSCAASYEQEGSVIADSFHLRDKGQRRQWRPLLMGLW